MCLPCKSQCQSPGLCSVFWVTFLHSLLPHLEGCGMLGLNGEALLEANLLTRHMEKWIPEGIDSPRVSPARTLVSAPHTGSTSVHSEHVPALDGMVVSVNRSPGCSDGWLERPPAFTAAVRFQRVFHGDLGSRKEVSS